MKTPNKMIGGMAGAMAQQGGAIDQSNQMQQSPVNPVALGSMQPQMPNMFGQPQPGVSYNNLMPNPSTPLNQGKQTNKLPVADLLNAKNSKEAKIATKKITDAQKKAKEEKERKLREERERKLREDKNKKDVVSGNKK